MATKLIEAIRAKEEMQSMSEIINSLPSVNPELSLDRNSEKIGVWICISLWHIIILPEFLSAKVSLVTQCVLYVGHKTISHSFMALTK